MPSFDSRRRQILKGALLGGGAVAVGPPLLAQTAGETGKSPSVGPPPVNLKAAEVNAVKIGQKELDAGTMREFVRDPGSDFMIDVFRTAGIRHVFAMSGSSFRGLHESIVNYAGDENPDLIVCVNEEISAAAAHGYAKIAGEMAACMVHNTVGLQHASMAIYDAYCDRVPMMIVAGNVLDVTQRRPGVEWYHTTEDLAVMVRDFLKWDDMPISLQHFAESFMRACEIARTPPNGPVMIIADVDLQERSIAHREALAIPPRAPVAASAGERSAIERTAAFLLAAERPVIAADRAAHSQSGVDMLVELAELVGAPVLDQTGRMNMPTTHYLYRGLTQRDVLANCDMLLGLELSDIWGTVNVYADLTERTATRILPADARIVTISANHAYMKGNIQDIQRYQPASIAIAADAQTCLPQLTTEVRRQMSPEQRDKIAQRMPALRAAHATMRAAEIDAAALGWDASPISVARVVAELWEVIKDKDWALVSDDVWQSYWPHRLWEFTKFHQYAGGSGGYGVGYSVAAMVGAALAHKEAGRLPVAMIGDGDFLMLPGSLWTLAHHNIPLLTIIHNNRAWHQETMHLQRMANRRNRGAERFHIGTTITEPIVDYASIARGLGVWAEGPVSDPNKLGAALRRALAIVTSGKPALLDIVMQPR